MPSLHIPLQTSIQSFLGLPGDHKSSQCSDSPSPETWDLECTQLDMMFDQQEHITSKLFDEFLFMKCDKFYQEIYNNKTSEDTMSSSVKETEVVRFEIVNGRIIVFSNCLWGNKFLRHTLGIFYYYNPWQYIKMRSLVLKPFTIIISPWIPTMTPSCPLLRALSIP